jgi:hypothetical protein
MGIFIPVIAIFSIFIGAPAVVFSFIYMTQKEKNELKKLQLRKEILEAETEKEKIQMLRLEAENKRYDQILEK